MYHTMTNLSFETVNYFAQTLNLFPSLIASRSEFDVFQNEGVGRCQQHQKYNFGEFVITD